MLPASYGPAETDLATFVIAGSAMRTVTMAEVCVLVLVVTRMVLSRFTAPVSVPATLSKR